MNDGLCKVLCSLVKENGLTILRQPLILRGLLTSACEGGAREIELLMIALQENIPGELASKYGNGQTADLIKEVIVRIMSKYQVTRDEALWTINSWITAMEPFVVSPGGEAAGLPASVNELLDYSVNNYTPGEGLQPEPMNASDKGTGCRSENCSTTDTLPDTANTATYNSTSPQVVESGGDIVSGSEVKVDNVHFTATSLKSIITGQWFLVDIWAHLGPDRDEVLKRAREQYDSGDIASKSRGPARITRNTLLTVVLEIEGATIENPEEMLLWDGEISNVTFRARTDLEAGTLHGAATIRLEGLQIARVFFDIGVGKDGVTPGDLHAREEIHKKAFVSYASQDRKKVIARLQGIKKIAPYLDIFMDVLSLRSGDLWEEELWKIIPENDVFYLFWSDYAMRSPWVEKEWKCALQVRGIGFIDPIPLVSPQKAPPPPELSKKHFNDPLLPYINEEDNGTEFDF
jgi:hypothetical protein